MSTNALRLSTGSVVLLVMSLFASQAALASWVLDNERSRFYYVTSKSSAVSEVNTFGDLSGDIDEQGLASLAITLASVDTAVDIRNERMRNIVFDVTSYPLARIFLDTSIAAINALSVGQALEQEYSASVELHGNIVALQAILHIVKDADGGLVVTLARPLLVNAAMFGLAEGVEQLRELAKLPSINNNVVIDFTLQFDVTD